jgi:PKD repeat protein
VAQFTASCTQQNCSFNGGSSTDDHGISHYAWTFGDGGGASDLSAPSHGYAASGTYQVTLTVTDAAGQTGTATHSVTVDLPPVAQFTSSCAGLTCAFIDVSTDDHGIISRAWTFGDGATGTEPSPTHTYPSGALTRYGHSFDVTLAVTDAAGQRSSVTQSVTAYDMAPVAHFTYSCTRTVCTFDGRASTDDGQIVSYTWSFGTRAADTATGATASFDFKKPGTYTVFLRLTDNAGWGGGLSQTITVTK